MAGKRTNLDAAIAAINNEFGQGTMLRASQVKWAHFHRIPTGVFGLDVGIGGGIPRGRIVQVMGYDSDGKTTLALLTIAQFQHTCMECVTPFRWYTDQQVDAETGEVVKEEMVVVEPCKCGANVPHKCLIIDSEGTFDPVWAAKLGVDVPTLYYVTPEYGEQGVDIVNKVVRTGELGLVVLDSVAQFTPGREVEESAEVGQRPDLALLMNRFMRTLQSGLNSLGLLNDKKPSIMLINQFREKVGVMWGDPRTWPGGLGQNFAASIRLFLRAGQYINEKGEAVQKRPDEVYGRVIHWHAKKNKTALPETQGTFKLFNRDIPALGIEAGSINNFEQMVEYGVFLGLINKSGSWYDLSPVLGDDAPEKSIQGMNSVMDYLRQNPDAAQRIRHAVMDKI